MRPELWLIKGKTPFTWTVPFWVTRRQSHLVELVEAPAILNKQRHILSKHLSKFGEYRNYRWVIPGKTLEEIGKRMPEGTDPDSLVSWGKNDKEPQEKPKAEVSTGNEDMDDFLDALLKKGIGDSRATLVFWWLSFCKHAQDWLINKERPVPMWFVNLHSSPYRRNWMWVLLTRFPKFWRSLTFTPKNQVNTALDDSGFIDEMFNPDLLAMHKTKGMIYRYVEIEHLPTWHKTVRAAESARLERLGWKGYAARVLASVRRRLLLSVRLYRQWLADCAVPSAQDVECNEIGECRLAPHVPRTPVTARGLRRWYVPTVIDNKYRWHQSSQPRDLFAEDDPLPELPTFRFNFGHLRHGRGEPGRSCDGRNGAPRMLVPNVSEIDPRKNDVLAVLEDERERRLAEGIKRAAPVKTYERAAENNQEAPGHP